FLSPDTPLTWGWRPVSHRSAGYISHRNCHFPQRPGTVGAGSGPLMTVSPRPWLSHRVMAAWAGAGNTIAWWRMQPRPSLTSSGLFFGGGFGRERKHIRFTAGRGRPRLPQDQQVEGK